MILCLLCGEKYGDPAAGRSGGRSGKNFGWAGNPGGEAKIVVGKGHASGVISGNQVVTLTGDAGQETTGLFR